VSTPESLHGGRPRSEQKGEGGVASVQSHMGPHGAHTPECRCCHVA